MRSIIWKNDTFNMASKYGSKVCFYTWKSENCFLVGANKMEIVSSEGLLLAVIDEGFLFRDPGTYFRLVIRLGRPTLQLVVKTER